MRLSGDMEGESDYIDISVPISPALVTWPGDPRVVVEKICDIGVGAECTVTRLAMGAHTGTHIDAPAHFVRDGAPMSGIPLQRLIGPVTVIQLDDPGPIRAAPLDAALPQPPERLLIRTRNSRLWATPSAPFHEDFTACSREAAHWLVENGVRFVGIDYLSVAPMTDGTAVHRILLNAGIVLLEGLDLRAVAPGNDYELICLPLRLDVCEAAPARAVLRRCPPPRPDPAR